MRTHVNNGIIQTESGYAVKNFSEPNKDPIPIGTLSFPNYKTAIKALENKFFPSSYSPYLIAVKELESPNDDTWNNLIFTGHAYGVYDHQEKRFKHARELDIGVASESEQEYINALDATYKSIKSMITN